MASILNKVKLPYRQQPPSGFPARRDGIGKGLVYASPVAYESVEHIAGNGGWGKFAKANTNAPTYSKTISLGKTVVFDETNNTPIQAANMGGFALPMTIMITFRANTWAGLPVLIGIGSSGASGGWNLALDATVIQFTLAGVNNYQLTPSPSLAIGVDYVMVVTVTGDGGNVQAWARNMNSSSSQTITTSPMAIGTMDQTFSNPLTLGAEVTAGSYTNPGGSHLGSFALWNRAISVSEVYDLLQNPYCLWLSQESSRTYASPVSSVGSSSGSATALARSASSAVSINSASVSALAGSIGTSIGSETGVAKAGSIGSSVGSASCNAIATGGAQAISAGSAIVAGIGASNNTSVAASTGSGTGSAVGIRSTQSIGSSTGLATGSGVAIRSYRSVGTSTSLATVLGFSKNRVGVGSAVGLATVLGKVYVYKKFRILSIDPAGRTISIDALPPRVISIDSVPQRVVYFEYD